MAKIEKIHRCIIGVGLLLCLFLLCMDIIFRYLHIPSNSAEEAIRYIMTWVTFLGSSLCFIDKSHYGIKLFDNITNSSFRKKIESIISIISIIFSTLLGYFGIKFVIFAYKSKQITASMRLPIWIVYFCVPLSAFLNIIYISKYKLFEERKYE